MASPIQIIDEDEEEFDWDAAVREIDVACRNSAGNLPQTPPPSVAETVTFNRNKGQRRKLKKTLEGFRQSTLDKFVGNGVGDDDEIGKTEIQDRVSFLQIDSEAAQTWIYPDNVPRRDYQIDMTKTALFSNTLVALPTGLGKTLIAAVVMYNYFRWFPEGKIVFAAPSRPLVMQQIEACHNIVGIPQEWTIDMTGLISPPKRASLWKSKRVFFLTPQVLEKDIQSGACLVKYLVCLVIDEAHRAMGNYSYCVAVRELMAIPVELRILALTATPGSKQQTIQQVIDNLQISTLEYRNENDHDVFPYVHNRKLELIEVPMGKNAIEINNLILEAIRPIAARLFAMGLLQNRDIQTLSPCDLLNSRDKFRQAPPPELADMKYGEVEGFYGVLITLYHIRKLLSSHGIRPAHEMLEEKLQQGYFARLMSRNEAIQRAKLLMQQSLSCGAPSPKLSKMIEILVDHFKTNDPQHSRVIIFSNFRGSVRDILDSLANIGNSVKATQFIGQSSGKILKGQNQKVQQAVLEKFRMGGYNVIVATSIGEEGLDIMEVDLVICFDANISPLRMIQRMGRTGRKHDGRVVVLACEGTEVKGYMRKQATGKAVRKHMQNGGINSFNFHPSSRMVPHFLKPELQFKELSIEKFVRHTKKVKNDAVEASTSREKLTITSDEAALLEKYFLPIDKICKPSLIAFPHFQAFPSRVHRVMHSSRTGWLIDVMQTLQGFSFSTASGTCGGDSPRRWCLATGSIEQFGESRQDIEHVNNTCEQNEIYNPEFFPSGPSMGEKDELDSPGKVLDNRVPHPSVLPLEKPNVPDSFIQHLESSPLPTDLEMLEAAAGDSMLIKTLSFDEISLNENVGIETEDAMAAKSPASTAGECDAAIADVDLSPRLSNFIQSGFVPESPLSNTGMESEDIKEILPPEPKSPPRSCANSLAFADEEVIVTECPQITFVKASPEADGMHTPVQRAADGASMIEGTSGSPFTSQTPLQDLTNSSCSRDWRISSGEKSGTVERPTKFRRLRKIGDFGNKSSHNTREEKSTCSAELARRFSGGSPNVSNHRKVKRLYEDARDFIDEEAEVSSEDVIPDSEDEGNHEDSDAYEDSFINDEVEPTAGTSQAGGGRLDMMAIYRRSLLTQSPFRGHLHPSSVVSRQSVASITTTESEDCSRKTYTLQTPQGGMKSPNVSVGGNSVSSHLNCDKTIQSMSSSAQAYEANLDSQKGKMSSSRPCALPPKNLEKEFCFHSGPSSKAPLIYKSTGVDTSFADLSDDQFYEGLDLDELEAQAAKLISQKTGSVVNERRIMEPYPQDSNFLGSPSFDLGIS